MRAQRVEEFRTQLSCLGVLGQSPAFAEYHRLMSHPPMEVDTKLVVGVLDAFLTWEQTQRAKRTYDDRKWHYSALHRCPSWRGDSERVRVQAASRQELG